MQLELMRSFKGDSVRSFCVAFACFVLRELIVCVFLYVGQSGKHVAVVCVAAV